MTHKTILIIELQHIAQPPHRPRPRNEKPTSSSTPSSANSREQRRLKARDNFVATITQS